MIYRETQTEWTIRTTGEEEHIILDAEGLRARLQATGLWLAEDIEGLLAMDVGDSTQRPIGGYVEDADLDKRHMALGVWRAETELRAARKHPRGQEGFWGKLVERHLFNEVRDMSPKQRNRVCMYRDYFGVTRYDFVDTLGLCDCDEDAE